MLRDHLPLFPINNLLIPKIKGWGSSVKDFLPAGLFLLGFSWDALSLQRIDRLLDLTIFFIYLVLAGMMIVFFARGWPSRLQHFFPALIQFFFGSLLSAFVIYYFKSASGVSANLFVLGLLVLLLLNERFGKNFSRLTILSLLFALCSLMYFTFALPVIIKVMNHFVFLTSVGVSFGSVHLLKSVTHKEYLVYKPTLIIYLLMVVSYFLNVIPPVPLSKKELHIYRSIQKTGQDYHCILEKPAWYSFSKKSETLFKYREGDTVFCYAAVFAPVALKKKIFHHWCFWNPAKGQYEEQDKQGYLIQGGRKEGYRGFTFKKNVSPGRWLIELKTEEGKVLGTVNFNIIPYPPATVLKTETLVF